MEADEEFARMLQQQFDEEAAAAETREQLDTQLAHRLARDSHQLSDFEDEEEIDVISSITGSISSANYKSNNLKKTHTSTEHSSTKIIAKSDGCIISVSKSDIPANCSSSASSHHPKSSSKTNFKPASPTKLPSSKLLGKVTGVDDSNKYQKQEASSPSKKKKSPSMEKKDLPGSSIKCNITSSNKRSLDQSFEDLSALEERKLSKDAVSSTTNKDKYLEANKSKSANENSINKLEESSKTVHPRKQQKSLERMEFTANVKNVKSTPTKSSISDCSIVKSLSEPGSSRSKASPSDKPNSSALADRRPMCKYGARCYRTNPVHLREFRHSEDSDTLVRKKEVQDAGLKMKKAKSENEMDKINEKHVNLKQKSPLTVKQSPEKKGIAPTVHDSSSNNLKRQASQNGTDEPPLKKKRSGDSSSTPTNIPKGFAARLAASDPYRLFITKSFSVPASHNDPLGCVLPDLLSRSLGSVVETAQFSFVVDLDFVYESYKACGIADKPLLLLYGEMEGATEQFPNGTFVKVSMPFLYGTHHTKLILLLYTEGLRVVVHTANLRADDWFEKTQGVWVSPLFPKMDVRPATPGCPSPGDSPTLFRQDLLQYLQSYKLSPLARWCDIIRRHDFAECNAVFVGHVPGYHAGPALPLYGQLKLRRALGRNTSKDKWRGDDALRRSSTVIQCSSIGSLGKDATWVSQDLGASLSGGQGCPASKVVVMYPSEEDVRLSSQGWGGGSCLPYQSNTHAKQPWLVKHLHHWRSDTRNRTKAMPHIKTYTRLLPASSSSLNTSGCEAQYLLLTSANLSKAAWGQVQKQGAQLFIRSYEAGVLLLPKFVTGEESFPLSGARPLQLPYDLPPTPYTSNDRPWFMDTNKKDKDINGDTYP